MWARVALHEYDHMLGQNFTMRVSKVKLDRAIKKAKSSTKQLSLDIETIFLTPVLVRVRNKELTWHYYLHGELLPR